MERRNERHMLRIIISLLVLLGAGARFQSWWSALVFVMQVAVMSNGGSGSWASDENE